jgi:hypothetical protein
MSKYDIRAWLIALLVVVCTLTTSFAVSNMMLNGNTKEIDTTNMSDEQIRLLELWMGVE